MLADMAQPVAVVVVAAQAAAAAELAAVVVADLQWAVETLVDAAHACKR
jgi:hypothetical protein